MATRQYSGVVSPEATRDLEAVSERLRNFGPTALATVMDAGRTQLTAAWTQELAKRPGFNAQQRRIVTANPQVAVGAAAGAVAVAAATGGAGPTSQRSGTNLGMLTRQFEFGADREAFRLVRQRGLNGKNSVRRTRRQLPSISARGWIAYPAAGAWSARVYKMVMQIVVKVAHDAIDGGSRG